MYIVLYIILENETEWESNMTGKTYLYKLIYCFVIIISLIFFVYIKIN